jgi:hypothetical protein
MLQRDMRGGNKLKPLRQEFDEIARLLLQAVDIERGRQVGAGGWHLDLVGPLITCGSHVVMQRYQFSIFLIVRKSCGFPSAVLGH